MAAKGVLEAGGTLSALGSLAWMLLCIVVVLALAYLFTRYGLGRWKSGGMAGSAGNGQGIRVLARTALGRESQVLVVEAGGRYFLLGATGTQISCLAELTAEEAEAFKEGPEGQPVQNVPDLPEPLIAAGL